MAQDRQQILLDGQAVLRPDFSLPFQEAALAEDIVLQELLRIPPGTTGAVSKAILPYAVQGSNLPLVAPNNATGSVYLQPFRVIVGSRTTVSGTAGSALLNWNDARSRVYAVTGDNVHLGQAVAFGANGGSTPRWDVIYVSIAVDQNNPNVNRNVRAPGTPATAPPVSTSVVPSLTQTLTVAVQAGTAAASPTLPAIPADTLGANGTFYVAIAAVLIPPGFGATTVVLPQWIFMQTPVLPVTTALGGIDSRPLAALAAGLPVSAVEAWGAAYGSANCRTPMALPATRMGGVRKRFGFDATTASPLFGDTAVLDGPSLGGIDWRLRDFTVRCDIWPGATQFAWQPGATSGAVPNAIPSTSLSLGGQSYVDDSALVLGVSSRNAGVVFFANHAALSPIASGSNAIGLYVSLATGNLCVYYLGTPGQLLVFTIEATAPFDNVYA